MTTINLKIFLSYLQWTMTWHQNLIFFQVSTDEQQYQVLELLQTVVQCLLLYSSQVSLQQQTITTQYITKLMERNNWTQPWNLDETCKLNNTKLKMFVKMVHVDSYKNKEFDNFSKSRNERSYTDHNPRMRYKYSEETNSYLIPSQIVNNIPIWNHRKVSKTSHGGKVSRNRFIIENSSSRMLKSASGKKSIRQSNSESRKKMPSLPREQSLEISNKFKLKSKNSYPLRMSTAPNQCHRHSAEREITMQDISLLSRKSIRPKVGDLVQFNQQKQSKIKRFRKKINQAKIKSVCISEF